MQVSGNSLIALSGIESGIEISNCFIFIQKNLFRRDDGEFAIFGNLNWLNKSELAEKSCLAVESRNEKAFVGAFHCSEKRWAICQSIDSSNRIKDENICAVKDEIHELGHFSKTVCLVGKKMTFKEGKSACEAQNMSMLDISDKAFKESFYETAKLTLKNGSKFWLKNQTCHALNESSEENLSFPCAEKLWTYCETKERKPTPFHLHFCAYQREIFNDHKFKKTACYIPTSLSFEEAIDACMKNNMSLMTIENSDVKKAFLDYAVDSCGFGGILWLNGRMRSDGVWYSSGNKTLLHEMKPVEVKATESCLVFNMKPPNGSFSSAPCDHRRFAYCGKTIFHKPKSNGQLCVRKRDFYNAKKVLVKTVCEVLKASTYFEALTMCHSEGMGLLVIDSTESQTALFRFVRRNATFWINGRRGNSGWFSYNPEAVPIFPGLSWSPNKTSATCLSLFKNGNHFEATANGCNEAMLNFYCEYQ